MRSSRCSLIIPRKIRRIPNKRKAGKITNAIIPMYGFCSVENNSMIVRKTISPKLTDAIDAPTSVVRL